MEISIDIENGYFSVTADINNEEVLQETINNFFKAYFEKHTSSTNRSYIALHEDQTIELANNEFGLAIRNGQIMVSSRDVSRVFGKRHHIVMRDIRLLECSAEFRAYNFVSAKYSDAQSKPRPEVYMTQDGFTFLVMGYTGKIAAKFKEKYIEAFNEMERALNR